MNLFSNPHRRYNPLTSEWILISPHRTERPWLGQVEKIPAESRPAYDPNCYLCPGNERAGGKRNPTYEDTFVFDNDFAALLPDPHSNLHPSSARDGEGRGLILAESERGVCRVICFSPRHDWTLPDMPLQDIRRVVNVWIEQARELGALDYINYVQIFENKGAAMGASNPHPHCQVWANEHVPTEPAKELRSMSAYRDEHDTCLLCNYLALELEQRDRIVLENEHFCALVPFWAIWPFETMVLARRHIGSLPEMNDAERDALADIVKRLTTRYDNLFEISFPYSMGWHQSPTDGAVHPEAHLHAHYYPPLLRSATVRKFMVGYEMLANPQRDLTAETAAARLREMSDRRK
jgi:UDPglucose--hexose-1-phosphate uridylyltransferase